MSEIILITDVPDVDRLGRPRPYRHRCGLARSRDEHPPTQSPKADNAADLENDMDQPTELNLSADDASLSERARTLIRIGEIGIAKEDKQAMTGFFNPAYRFHGPDGGAITREELWGYFEACRAAFDNLAVTRQQIFSDGGAFIAARTTFSGVFTRPFTASPLGTVQPNGKSMFYKINNIFRYAVDGTLLEEWAQYDSLLFLQRLGVKLVAGK